MPPADEILSSRARAGLAAALLATTSTPAAPALAGEGDSEHEGAADEKAPAGETDPGFGDGTDDVGLPVDDGSELPSADEEGEVEQAPLHESRPDDGAPENDPGGPAAGPPPPSPTGGAPSPDAPLPPSVPLPPVSVPPLPAQPPNAVELRQPPGSATTDGVQRLEPKLLVFDADPIEEPSLSTTPLGEIEPPAGAPAVSEEPVDPAPVAHAGGGNLSAAPNYARDRRDTHIVTQGECLWSIARDEIGGDPSPAQVARLVNQLWELNRERIGTGEPDLLMVGTELRMP